MPDITTPSQKLAPDPAHQAAPDPTDLRRERWELLRQVDALLDTPMIVLSFVWLGLMIVELTTGLGPILQGVSYVIWALFIIQFAIGIVIAPSKLAYLRHNWPTLIALVLPAFRVLQAFRLFRVLRAARAVRSVGLVRVLTSLNRGMRAINMVMGRRGIGYVLALTTIVTFAGAAGMARLESPPALREAGVIPGEQAGAGLDGYGEALWWTAMTMTTMGSNYSPQTLEGRILGWLLAVYAFAIFGYITATIASLFVSQDVIRPPSSTEPAASDTFVGAVAHGDDAIMALRQEVAALRRDVTALTSSLPAASPPTRPSEPAVR